MTINQYLLVASLTDPAIDIEGSDWDQYLKTRVHAPLKCKEGQTPVLFKIKRIPTDMLLRLREYGKGDRATYRYLCFLSACSEYSFGDVVVSANLIPSTTVAEDVWLDQLRDEFGMETVEEMVDVAYKFQTLSKRNPHFV
jgi:hypothetical protein